MVTLALLLLCHPASHGNGCTVSYGRMAAVSVYSESVCRYHPELQKYLCVPRYTLKLAPCPDPLWRERDYLALHVGDRLSVEIETCLFRWADKGGFSVLEPVSTKHEIVSPLLQFVPPLCEPW